MEQTEQPRTPRRKKTPPTPNRKALFLSALRESGNATHAARVAELDRRTAFRIRKRDPEFAKAWEDALDVAADGLEAEARRRAVEGVERPVFGRSGPIGTVRDYSDLLLIFLLKGARPEKYRERRDVQARIGVSTIADLVAQVAKEEDPSLLLSERTD